MKHAIEQFEFIINETRHISNIYAHFNIPNALDDLLRWQWTQAVSALDKYIHDIVTLGLIKAFNKEISQTRSFSNFTIPISIIYDSVNSSYFFNQFIVKKLSYQSFQTPDKIGEALSLIWPEEHKWQKIGLSLDEDATTIKNTLNLIAQRRNQIVHQSDYPSENLERESITIKQATWVIDYIDKLVHSLHNELNSYLSTS